MLRTFRGKRLIVQLLFIYYSIAAAFITSLIVNSLTLDHCYPDLGCFPLTEEFYHPRHRPFNVRPWHRKLINTNFELFNRKHPKGFMLRPWDRLNLIESNFNPNYETKIIIPGWLDNIRRVVWIRKMKEAFLWLWKPCNIIVIHWRNFTPYTIATANTRVVGAELANLMKFIELQLNYNRTYYHLIGHSLGAHISGYAGNRLPGLGRITALDPARPFFQHMPKSIRLDRGDAHFVDAIHSDYTPENAVGLLMSYGMTTPVGHLDFYPNGPPLLQPGCLRDSLLAINRGLARGLQYNSLPVAFLESIRYLSACDHQRAHEYFIESILNQKCAFIGVRCNSFEGLINGRCSCDDSKSACCVMGIHSNQMYLNNVHEELWPAYPHKWPQNSARGDVEFRREPEVESTQLWEFQQLLNLNLKEDNEEEEDPFGGESLEFITNDDIFNNYLKLGLQKSQNRRQSSAFNEDDDLGLSSLLLMNPNSSEGEREIEKWYEQNSRWFLKTNNQPNYCATQYQVLVFTGPLQISSGLDHLRANFVLTIIGSRGRITGQRFKPTHPNLTPFTMQPFFIILDGSYSLGDILAVAIAWEERIDPDPIQATISFESKLLEKVQPMLPTYKAKHPWLSETIKYDFSPAFRYNSDAFSNRIDNNQSQNNKCQISRRANNTQTKLSNFYKPTPSRRLDHNNIVAKLHNIPVHKNRHKQDTIVIRKVVVSPLVAAYGKNGPRKLAKTFCPARADFRLERERTLRLLPSLDVNENCYPIGQMRQGKSFMLLEEV